MKEKLEIVAIVTPCMGYSMGTSLIRKIFRAELVEKPKNGVVSISEEEACLILEQVVKSSERDLVPVKKTIFAVSLEDEVKMNEKEEIPKIAAMVVQLHEDSVFGVEFCGRWLAYVISNPEIQVLAETEEKAMRELAVFVKKTHNKTLSRKVFAISFEDIIVEEMMGK